MNHCCKFIKLFELFGGLTCGNEKKIAPIPDNLRARRPVKESVAERKDKIELSYPPGCSPELNPEERLNRERKKAKLRAAATEYMALLERNQEPLSYFQDPHVQHAA